MRDRNKSLFFTVLCVLAVCQQSLLYADTYEEVTTVVGEEFQISLPSNPSTGYSWSMAEHLPDWLELVDTTYAATNPGVIGGGGTETWTFRAAAAGSATLTFEYKRPWEVTALQVHVCQVTAQNQADVEKIDVLVGKEFQISLPSNPSTGYSWSVAEHLPDWLELVDTTYAATNSGVIGGGGTETWTFRATGPGSATLTFEYQRPWEDTPIQVHVCQVTAQNPTDTEKIDVPVGKEFQIGLQSNPSTGYSWSVAEHLPDWLELVGTSFAATNSGVIGGGGTETWTFRATSPGSTTLTFQYMQPWVGTPAEVRVYQITATAPEPNAPTGIVFVKIPAGTFQMGDIDGSGYANERPVHTVTLRDFEMSKYETTNAQYAAYLNEALAHGAIRVLWGTVYASTDSTQAEPYFDTASANSYSQIEYSQGRFSVRTRDGQSMSDHPVVQVSWYGAKAFCDYYGYRLPTEAEWEYAARGGPNSLYYRYPWGANTLDSSNANCNAITYSNPVGLITYPYTSPVGYYGPQGAYGLCDLCGNVWEFCADWYSATYYSFSPADNPSGPVGGKMRVVRGGSWNQGEYRVSYRSEHTPTSRNWDSGFRVCR